MASIHFDITGDNKQVLQSLKQTMDAITQLENKTTSADKNVGKGFSKMGKTISSELAGMATRFLGVTAAIGAFVGAIRKAYQVNKDFERKNSELASVLGTTRQGIKELSDSAQSLGRTTEFTSTEVTELQIALSRLGFQKGQILEMQGTVLKFAAAVNTDLGRAANFAGAALRGFGLEATDTAHLLDVMAAATTKSALDFSKLETSMSIVAPIAHAFGLSAEDTVTLLGALSNAGFDASSAATATRNILLNLADANGKLAKGLGHTARTFPEIIEALKECKAKGMDLNSTLEMTDRRSVSAFNALISGAASADELREALGKVDGTLNDMYKTMTDNVAGGIKQVQSAWEGLLLTMQNSTGPIANMLKSFARGLNVITDLIQGVSMKDIRNQQRGEALLGENYTYEQLEQMLKELDSRLDDENYKYKNQYNGKELPLGSQMAKRKADEKLRDAVSYALAKKRGERFMAKLESDFAKLDSDENGTTTQNPNNSLSEDEKKALKKKAEERKKLEKQLNDELDSMLLDNEQARLGLYQDGTKKEIEQIRVNYEKRKNEVKKLEDKWREDNGKAGRKDLNARGLTTEQAAAIDTASGLNEASRQKAINEVARKNREEYLKEYGTYEEKKLAINEEYVKKVLATEDEYERMSLAKKRDQDLDALRKQYDTSYNLIFADAGRLSDNLLVKAIKATQKEIEKATSEGKIQELESLYARLREQMEVQSSRNDEWGFVGLGSAFRDIEKAKEAYEKAVESGSQEDVIKAASEYEQAISKVEKKAEQIQTIFSEIGSIMEDIGGTIGEIGSSLGSLSGAAKSIMDAIESYETGSHNPGESIASIATAAIEIGGMLAKSINSNNEAQKEWNRTIDESAHKLAMLNLEALDYKQQNIFGVESPYKKAIDGALQYGEAMKNLVEQTRKLSDGKVQTKTKKAIDWSNVAKGAATGAAAGAVAGGGAFSWLTTGIGAAVGAVVGAFSTKTVPVFESLAQKYGKIVNDDFTLNPQILADYNKLDDDTKQLVDNWKEIKAKAEEAQQQMKDTFTSLSGDIGGQLSDSLVNAFTDGRLDSAIDGFHDKLGGTIEDIVEQMVFSNVFSEMFDNLEKEMNASFGSDGDRNIVDDLIRFEEAYQSGLEEYGRQMADAKEYLSSQGYDAWNRGSDNETSSSRGFAAMSQETGNELNGRFTAIQISNETIAQNSLAQTGYLLTIKDLVAGGSSVLADIRNMHAIEASYLEDIARQTKPIPVMVDTLDKIQRNTANL